MQIRTEDEFWLANRRADAYLEVEDEELIRSLLRRHYRNLTLGYGFFVLAFVVGLSLMGVYVVPELFPDYVQYYATLEREWYLSFPLYQSSEGEGALGRSDLGEQALFYGGYLFSVFGLSLAGKTLLDRTIAGEVILTDSPLHLVVKPADIPAYYSRVLRIRLKG